MPTAECQFCEIVDRSDPEVREIYRDENVIAFFPTEPAVLGHTLVIPRRHVPDIWSLRTDEAAQLSAAVLRLAEAVRAAVSPQGLNVIQSNGAAATQTVSHLHIHLVPRNEGDAIGHIWPQETDYSEDRKNDALKRMKSAVSSLKPVEPEVSPEDRRKHLDYIQAVVTRQSTASASAKGWLLPVVTAVFGFALTQHAWLLALLGMFLIAMFAYIDANYLRSEKAYRALYTTVSRSQRMVPRFTLNPEDAYEPQCGDAPAAAKWKALRDKYFPSREVWMSWSIAPFYSAMLLLGIGVAFTAAFTADKDASLPHGPATTTIVVSTVPVSSPSPTPVQPALPPG
ncbi:protein hit [Mycobacteroides stephanolepidis]|uniref:Protein hit n=1 Tax=[Mycobacterium] stephanolepidis TaxID=1520670 RepID=A0A1Z4EVS3_9MYCO|nr:HIT domain-containing protein [[Mycobacterium] stephanolepidis]BAX97068.1 protein hit [[Mycobacterium] stephanolepidis]